MIRLFTTGFFIGWFAFLSEFLLFRESFVLFGANDLAVGFLYFIWFSFSALGAYLAHKYTPVFKAKRAIDRWIWQFGFVFLFSLIVFLWFITSINFRLGIEPSVIVLFFMQLLAVSPVAFFIGRLYGLGTLIESPSQVLFAETIAFSIASLLITGLLLLGVSISIVVFMGMSVFSLWFLRRRYYLLSVLFLLFFHGIFMFGYPYAKKSLYENMGVKELVSRDSPYGRFQVFLKNGQEDIFYMGRFVGEKLHPQNLSAAVHLASVNVFADSTGNPRSILIVGDMGRGIALEADLYSYSEIVFLETDINVLDFEKSIYAGLLKSKLDFIQGDFLQMAARSARRFDVIFFATTPHMSLSSSRFLSKRYLTIARKVLKPNGIVAVLVHGDADVLSESLLDIGACVMNTLEGVFKYSVYVPCAPAIILASDKKVSLDADFIVSEMRNLSVSSVYFKEGYIRDLLSKMRLDLYRSALSDKEKGVKPNTFHSMALHFYEFMFSMQRQFGMRIANLLKAIKTFGPVFIVFMLACVFLSMKKNDYLFVSLVSFVHVSLYMAALLAYQFLFGVIFLEIGMLSALYMVSLSIGLFYARNRLWYLKWFNVVMLLLSILILLVFWVGQKPAFWIFLFTNAFFHGLFLGAIMGYKREISAKVYWLDLLGAGASGLLFSGLVIVFFNVVYGVYFLILLSLGLFILKVFKSPDL